MKYMLLIYSGDYTPTSDEVDECYSQSRALAHELASEGKFISAAPLQPGSTGACLRGALVTDGPYIETKEQLGGYFMVDVTDMDEALQIAARLPGMKWGGVEVRPVVDVEDMP